ncbi:hypothetical protein DH2020_024611 [Rehmannia glutinosa]|uniref:Protein root UVB sensitive 2, chloroplastic n=1 Tax=Rehmannia glutinosa TaxID=99300 RepID=A0ABR0W1V5_REHGL
MDSEGQRTTSNPSAMLAALLCKRAKLHEELRNIEKQVYDMETSYLQDPSQCGNVLKGFEGFLSSSKNTTLLKRSRKFQPEDRLFSLSSVTSPAAEEVARDGGVSANGPLEACAVKAIDPGSINEIFKMQKKETNAPPPPLPVHWVETSDSVSHHFQYDPDGQLSVKLLDDARPASRRMVESFLNKFFPSGYPYSVSEGYLTYTQFRALQHFSSATLSVLSTQSLLFAAGLRPTPAQATAVSWILKDGMQHVGKLICSNLGARMDSEPKCWRILADVLYDFGTGLEVISPLCPHLFLEMAGLGNFAKGMAVVAARATRLPIYSSFAKEGNLSDLFAKGEAISTLFNVLGIGAGIQLASTVCSSTQGKLVVGPLLSLVHIYCVREEMRATPVNTLNPQRTALIVAEYLKSGRISSPADLRYQEDLLFPGRVIEEAGSVKVGRPLHKVVKPSELDKVKEKFAEERFIINRGKKWTDMILERNATGEDALRGWLVAAYAAEIEKSFRKPSENVLLEAYERMSNMFSPFISELQAKGWHTDRFLDGTGCRFAL